MPVIRTNLALNPNGIGTTGFGNNTVFTLDNSTGFGGFDSAARWTRATTGSPGRIEVLAELSASTQYTVVMQVKASVAFTGISTYLRPDVGSATGQTAVPIGSIPAGISEIRFTATTSATAYTSTSGVVFVPASATPAVGETLEIVGVQVEAGPTVGEFFSGATLSNIYRRYDWTGTANASTSTESTYANADEIQALASGRKMWFGNRQRFQAVPTPATGAVKSNTKYNESGTLENGGGWAVQSRASHANWAFDFPVQEAHGAQGLDVFREYDSGMWDWYGSSTSGFDRRNLIYFADPMNYTSNLFPPNWATPSLPTTGDWHWIGNYSNTYLSPANTMNMPPIYPEFSVTNTPYTPPGSTRNYVVIPIPPSHQLFWGWSGSRTGTGVVTARAINSVTGATADFDKTPNTITGAQRIGSVPISGLDYDHAIIFLNRTTAVTSLVRIASMTAQLWPIGVTPDLNGKHQQGMGTTGAVFDGGAVPESYVMVDPTRNVPVHYKGLSFQMREIGGWL